MELQENGDDEAIFVFVKEESFVLVDSFVLVFSELQKVVVVLFRIQFGHDGIKGDFADFLFGVVDNVRGLIVGNHDFAQTFISGGSPDQRRLRSKRQILDFFLMQQLLFQHLSRVLQKLRLLFVMSYVLQVVRVQQGDF